MRQSKFRVQFLSGSVTVSFHLVKVMNRRDCSGQVLLVGVLIIALLLLSTEIYVYDLGKAVREAKQNSFGDFVIAVRLGSKHVVAGSLAKVSHGLAFSQINQTLETNLEGWSSFVGRLYQSGKCILDYELRETAPYLSGIWIYWGANGTGFSGAYADFTLQLLDLGVDVNLKYATNTTTGLFIQSTYKAMQGSNKQVNVTCNLLNEGKPALAKNTTVYYKNETEWLTPTQQNNYSISDYGNGTYSMSFVANISSNNIQLSVQAYDQREIYVQSNITCTEI